MKLSTVLRASLSAAALTASPIVLSAQEVVAPPTPNADALAAQMRLLASNPRDLNALIAAGDLSVKLADPQAAMRFFDRAEDLSPGNARVLAGKAGALVLLERPGEALGYYDRAERAGAPMTSYLAQRGLAYDLIGQPGYAQRDYRRALEISRDDETVRRLALSLGISGNRDEAMQLLDPLLRRSDRAAWRARAFVLAMTGDLPGAERIATSMMPNGTALSPFFRRLQSLAPADRAFAVHFGEPTPTPARTADARLAPPLAVLPSEAGGSPQPVATAMAARPREEGRGRSHHVSRGRTPPPAPAPVPIPTPIPTPTPTPAPAQLASAPRRAPSVIAAPPRQISSSWAMTGDTAPERPALAPTTTPDSTPSPPAATPTPTPTSTSTSTSTPTPTPTPAPTPSTKVPVASPASPPAGSTPAPAPPSPSSGQAVLATIIARISVPSSELEPRTASAPPSPTPRPATVKKPEPKPAPVTSAAVEKPEARKPVARPKSKKADPPKPDPAKAEPARWWVQVAGGANAADLGKDWKRIAAKSPAAFRGRTAWTTPLRATNRLLAGPFKSQGEAMAFVNQLAKDGSSAFAWQSPAGQKIDKLGLK